MDSSFLLVSSAEMNSATTPVLVVENDVVDLWRTVGAQEGLFKDVDIARFLICFYLGYKSTNKSSQCHSCLGKAASATVSSQTSPSPSNFLAQIDHLVDKLSKCKRSSTETQHSVKNVAPTQSPKNLVTMQSPKNVAPTQSPKNLVTMQSPKNVAPTQSPKNLVTMQSPKNVAPMQSVQNVVTMQSPKNVVTTQSPKNVAPMQSVQNVVTMQSSKNVVPMQSSKNVVPMQSSKNVVTMQSSKNVVPMQSSKNVVTMQSPKNVAPMQSVQNVAPMQSVQNVVPMQSPKNVAPMQSVQNVVTMQSSKNVVTMQSSKNVVTMQSPKNVAPMQSPENLVIIQSSKNVVQLQSVKSLTTTQSPKNVVPTQSPKNVVTMQSPKNVVTMQSPKSLATMQSVKILTTTQSPKNVVPTQSPKNVVTMQSPKNVVTMQSSKNAITTHSVQNVVTTQSLKNVVPMQSSKNVAPMLSVQNAAAMQSVKSLTTTHSPKNAVTRHSVKNVATTHSVQNVVTMIKVPTQSPKNVAPMLSSKNVVTMQSPIKVVQSPKSLATMQSVKSLTTTQSQKNVATMQSPKHVSTTQSPKNLATAQSVQNFAPANQQALDRSPPLQPLVYSSSRRQLGNCHQSITNTASVHTQQEAGSSQQYFINSTPVRKQEFSVPWSSPATIFPRKLSSVHQNTGTLATIYKPETGSSDQCLLNSTPMSQQNLCIPRSLPATISMRELSSVHQNTGTLSSFHSPEAGSSEQFFLNSAPVSQKSCMPRSSPATISTRELSSVHQNATTLFSVHNPEAGSSEQSFMNSAPVSKQFCISLLSPATIFPRELNSVHQKVVNPATVTTSHQNIVNPPPVASLQQNLNNAKPPTVTTSHQSIANPPPVATFQRNIAAPVTKLQQTPGNYHQGCNNHDPAPVWHQEWGDSHQDGTWDPTQTLHQNIAKPAPVGTLQQHQNIVKPAPVATLQQKRDTYHQGCKNHDPAPVLHQDSTRDRSSAPDGQDEPWPNTVEDDAIPAKGAFWFEHDYAVMIKPPGPIFGGHDELDTYFDQARVEHGADDDQKVDVRDIDVDQIKDEHVTDVDQVRDERDTDVVDYDEKVDVRDIDVDQTKDEHDTDVDQTKDENDKDFDQTRDEHGTVDQTKDENDTDVEMMLIRKPMQHFPSAFPVTRGDFSGISLEAIPYSLQPVVVLRRCDEEVGTSGSMCRNRPTNASRSNVTDLSMETSSMTVHGEDSSDDTTETNGGKRKTDMETTSTSKKRERPFRVTEASNTNAVETTVIRPTAGQVSVLRAHLTGVQVGPPKTISTTELSSVHQSFANPSPVVPLQQRQYVANPARVVALHQNIVDPDLLLTWQQHQTLTNNVMMERASRKRELANSDTASGERKVRIIRVDPPVRIIRVVPQVRIIRMDPQLKQYEDQSMQTEHTEASTEHWESAKANGAQANSLHDADADVSDDEYSELKCSRCGAVFTEKRRLYQHLQNEICQNDGSMETAVSREREMDSNDSAEIKVKIIRVDSQLRQFEDRSIQTEQNGICSDDKSDWNLEAEAEGSYQIQDRTEENERACGDGPDERACEIRSNESSGEIRPNEIPTSRVDNDTDVDEHEQDMGLDLHCIGSPRDSGETTESGDEYLSSDDYDPEKKRVFKPDSDYAPSDRSKSPVSNKDEDSDWEPWPVPRFSRLVKPGERRRFADGFIKHTKVYRKGQRGPFTLAQFWTGKVRYTWGHRGKASHFICQWCGTIFPEEGKTLFKKHEKKCDMRIPNKKRNRFPPLPMTKEGTEILRGVKDKFLLCCNQCDRVFFYEDQRRVHAKSHSFTLDDTGAYICNHCGCSFPTFLRINMHMRFRTQHTIKSRRCDECGEEFESNCQWDPHMKMHREERERTCGSCGLSLLGMTKAQANKHLETHKQHPCPPNKRLCPYCGNAYTRASLKSHILTQHTKREKKPPPKSFSCQTCSKKFCYKTTLEAHQELHGEKNVICEHCGLKFFRLTALKFHIAAKHKGLEVRCLECGKLLSSRAHLKAHILRIHRKLLPFACQFCPLKFHLRYECDQHMRIHTEEKPFSCPQCDYKCKQKNYLKVHMAVHSKHKPHSCEDCSAAFRTRDGLKFHRKVHHKDLVYLCPACPGEKFHLRSSLDFHRYEHHGAPALRLKTVPDHLITSSTSVNVDCIREEASSNPRTAETVYDSALAPETGSRRTKKKKLAAPEKESCDSMIKKKKNLANSETGSCSDKIKKKKKKLETTETGGSDVKIKKKTKKKLETPETGSSKTKKKKKVATLSDSNNCGGFVPASSGDDTEHPQQSSTAISPKLFPDCFLSSSASSVVDLFDQLPLFESLADFDLIINSTNSEAFQCK